MSNPTLETAAMHAMAIGMSHLSADAQQRIILWLQDRAAEAKRAEMIAELKGAKPEVEPAFWATVSTDGLPAIMDGSFYELCIDEIPRGQITEVIGFAPVQQRFAFFVDVGDDWEVEWRATHEEAEAALAAFLPG